MNKKALTETDIRTKFITPALIGANGGQWNLPTQIRAELSHRSHFMAHGRPAKHSEAQKPNDILSHKPDLPPVVTKAKAHTPALGRRMQQALEYAEIPDVPNAPSTNGDAFPQHDRTATGAAVTREIPPDQYPSPAERWSHSRAAKGRTPQQQVIATQDYGEAGTRRMPRHYQQIAINRTVDAIARMESDRLLTRATGMDKTCTTVQIIRPLWKSSARKRIPFLVDRNILSDQTKTNDFKPFGPAMTKINNRTDYKSAESSLRAQRSNPVTRLGFRTRNTRASKVAGMLRRCAPRNEKFLRLRTLYQAVTGTEEEQNTYKQFSPGFLDLAISDECCRGSAADDGVWKGGRNPRADQIGHDFIHPRGCATRVKRFRRQVRDTVTPVVPPAFRWHPHDDAWVGSPDVRLTRLTNRKPRWKFAADWGKQQSAEGSLRRDHHLHRADPLDGRREESADRECAGVSGGAECAFLE